MIVGSEITSIRSPRVKAARQLAKRSFRQRARSFLAEGPQAVREALAMREPPDGGAGRPAGPAGGARGARGAGRPVVTELFVTGAAWSRYGELAAQAAEQGAAAHTVSGGVMAELAQTVTPQGVLGVGRLVGVPLEQRVACAPAAPG